MNLICGINPVIEALNAGTRHFDRLLVVKGLRNPRVSEAIARASGRGIPLRFEARETLDRMAGGLPHQGVIAVVSAKPVLDLDALFDQSRPPAFLVVLDGVEDPRNLGAILRSVEAAGGDGVVLPERHSSTLSETVSRASAGALEYVRVARVGNLAQSLERMKERGLWIVGFDAGGTTRWDAVDLKRPIAIVLGGEGRGIRRLVRERCDEVVSIPMLGHLSSLNVSVAAGIALFEVVRQRGLAPSHVKPIPPRAAGVVARQIVGPGSGDAERDPGAILPETLAGEGDDDVDVDRRGGLADDHIPAATIRFDHEELAWGVRPPEADERRVRRAEPDGRGGRARGRGARPEPRVDSRPGAAGEQARRGPGGRRRRHRRRGGRPDLVPGQGRPPEPAVGGPHGAGEAASPGEAPAGTPRSRGRRRRRRR
jgi:23S rRNA (guanosine2251-2'-O)-methyltransferase